MAFYQWSKNAGSNSTADATINAQEGMPPAQLNDGSRGMMARLAEYRDDTSGLLQTAGTGSAYTVSTNQSFASLALLNGAKLKIRFMADSAPNATLNADGQGAAPIQFSNGYGTTQGAIKFGSMFDVTYDNSIPAFILSGGVSPILMPIGAIMDYAGTSAPPLFVLCAGQAISRTTYASLFATIGTTYGIGDGSTTFNVPDYRGRVGAGLDNMNGSAAGRIGTALVTDSGTINGQTIGSAGGSQQHTQAGGEVGQHNHTATSTDSGHSHPPVSGSFWGSVGATGNTAGGSTTFGQASSTGNAQANISTTVNNSAAPSAMAWLQPTIMMNKIMYAGV